MMTSPLLFLTTFTLTYALAMSETVPKASISSHVLDTVTGKPAEGVLITAHVRMDDRWMQIGQSRTGADGRVPWVSPNFTLREGTYKIVFGVEDYYNKKDLECFYPYVEIVFRVDDATQHYHIPITLSPFAYSTYRGS